jgi:transcriptional regulator with XRE-family HTH domain
MSRQNLLLSAPPYAVEQTLKRLGANLRTARLRRNLTIHEIAQKIGTGPRAVLDAEKGKPSTSIGVYAGLLWALELLGQLDAVADPLGDEAGRALASSRERSRARRSSGGLSDDF